MPLLLRGSALLLCLSLVSTARAQNAAAPPQAAQNATAPPQTAAAATPSSGQQILQRKCAQCHAATMWTALRQDRRSWESTLYRMVGRGALWTPDEINAMADYLTQIRGAASAKATADKP